MRHRLAARVASCGRGLLVAAVAASLVLGSAPLRPVRAAAGDLDSSLGGDGIIVTNAGKKDKAFGVAFQADGKLVVVGRTADQGSANFTLARYLADGSLDASFGSGGIVTTDFGSNAFDEAYGVAIQSDGKIVLVGRSKQQNKNRFALARYAADGSLDGTFGGGGTVVTEFAEGSRARAVAIQADGKLVVAGQSGARFGLARYLANGTIDVGFGDGGRVTTAFTEDAAARNLAIQADGKIVVVGSSGRDYFALARYTADGSLDNGFDGDGKLTTRVGRASSARGVVVQGDGRIVAGGSSGGKLALVRYGAGGALDDAFGDDGTAVASLSGPARGNSVVAQSDGKLVVAGKSMRDAVLARFNPDGSLDSTFGDEGRLTTDTGGTEQVNALAIQPDGRIVAVGATKTKGSGTKQDFLILRYLSR